MVMIPAETLNMIEREAEDRAAAYRARILTAENEAAHWKAENERLRAENTILRNFMRGIYNSAAMALHRPVDEQSPTTSGPPPLGPDWTPEQKAASQERAMMPQSHGTLEQGTKSDG